MMHRSHAILIDGCPMTEHHYTAEGFLALARKAYSDVSGDEGVFDTVIRGRTLSMDVHGTRSLRLVGRCGDREETAVIDFPDDAGMTVDTVNGYCSCAWFDSMPEMDVPCPRFVNCVFTCDVDLDGLRGAEFHCCFFMGDVLCQNRDDMDYLRLEGCIVRGYLTVRSCRIRSVKSIGSDIGGVLLDDVRVTAEVEVSSSHIEESITLSASSFRGDSVNIEEVNVGNGIIIGTSVFICSLGIRACRASYMTLYRCRADSLDVDGLHLTTYSEVGTVIGTDAMVPEDRRVSLDKVTVGNGLYLSDVVATGLTLSDCVSRNGCAIRRGNPDSDVGFFRRMDDEVSPMPPYTYPVQVLDVSRTRFDGGLSIDRVYNHLGMMDPELGGTVVLDHRYNRITRGSFIGSTDPGCRMFTRGQDGTNHSVDPDVLLSVSEAMARNRQFEEAERYYISYKVRKRDGEDSVYKAAMYVHEVVSRFGKSPVRVFSLVILAILAFALLYCEAGVGTLEDCIYFSGYTFFTIGFGEVGPMVSFSKYLTLVEGGVGVVLMTYFVTTMCNKRR